MKPGMERSPPPPHSSPVDEIRVSYGAVNRLPWRRVEPRRSHLCRCPRDIGSACRSLAFLLVQGVVAWLVALVLLTCVVLCVVLLPLCGLGVVVFRLLFRLQMVAFGAACDATVINYIADDANHIQTDTSRVVLPLLASDISDGRPTERLVSDLDKVSAESVIVLLYLTAAKPLLATVGLCVTLVVIILPVLLFHAWLSHTLVLVSASLTSWEAFCAYTALVLLVVVAVMSMDVVVRWSEAATRFFCCERVYALPLPRGRATIAATTAALRPNVVVVRLPPSASTYSITTSMCATSTVVAANASSASPHCS